MKKIPHKFSKEPLNLLRKWEKNLRQRSLFLKEEQKKTDVVPQIEASWPTADNSIKIKKLSKPKILKEINAMHQFFPMGEAQFLSMTRIIQQQKIELDEKNAQIAVLESKIQELQKTESETFF